MPCSMRPIAGLLSILPLLIVPGLGLLGLIGGVGHSGQILHYAMPREERPDAPMPTAPLAERRVYTRALHREDLCTFQAKIVYWQAAAHAPGAAGHHARLKLAQWQWRSEQTRLTLDRQAQSK